MISRIASVPGTPLVIPEVAAGASSELDDVRAAALARVSWAAEGGGFVTVLAQDPAVLGVTASRLPESVSLSPLGLDGEIPTGGFSRPEPKDELAGREPVVHTVPVSVMVAVWLAATAGVRIADVWLVPDDPAGVTDHPDLEITGGLLVVADGSATRTPKAPGSFVEGSIEVDDRLVRAMDAVDADYFLDPARSRDARQFGIQGLGAWALAARLAIGTAAPWSGEVDITADPYGVLYVVAGWHRTS